MLSVPMKTCVTKKVNNIGPSVSKKNVVTSYGHTNTLVTRCIPICPTRVINVNVHYDSTYWITYT